LPGRCSARTCNSGGSKVSLHAVLLLVETLRKLPTLVSNLTNDRGYNIRGFWDDAATSKQST
jgi:hypothetical protein